MNYYEHHIGDYIKATAHLSMLEDAAYRRMIDAYYTKEAPLPADRKACHRLARATSKPERDAVDTILDEFFILADDGWHQTRCDEELAKYIEKRPAAEKKQENDKERQRRARERRKQLFEELSSYGINMPWNATTEMLQAELSRVTSGGMSQPVTEPVTRDNTATQSPVPSPQSPDIKNNSSESRVSGTEPPDSQLPENATRKGALSRQLRTLGIDAAPHLQGWTELLPAYSDAEIIAAAETARERKPGERLHLNYLLPILRDRKAPSQGPPTSSSRQSRIDNYAAQAAAARGGNGTENRPDGNDRIIDGEVVRVA